MDRRSFLKTTGAAAGAAAMPTAAEASAPTPARTNAVCRLRYRSDFCETLPILGEFGASLSRRLATVSDGRILVQLPGQQTSSDNDAELTLSLPTRIARRIGPDAIALELFGGIPGGLAGDRIDAWHVAAGGGPLLAAVGRQHGRKLFYSGRTGTSGFWIGHPVVPRGTYASHSGPVAVALGMLGYDATLASPGGALDDRELAGVEGLSPIVDIASGVLVRFGNYSEADLPAAEQVLVLDMPLDAWEAFAAADQALIESAIAAEAARIAPTLMAHAPLALAAVGLNDPARQGRPKDPTAVPSARLRGDILDWYAGKGNDARRIADSLRAFCRLSDSWPGTPPPST